MVLQPPFQINFYFCSTVPPLISIDLMADDLVSIRAGDPIRIPATIKGRPAPKVTWDFDGKAKSHKKNKLHTLPIDSEVRASFHKGIECHPWQQVELFVYVCPG